MNFVDIFLGLIVALAMWAGWTKGFILGFTGLLIWLGSLLMGFFLYRPLGEFLWRVFPATGVWALPIAFIVAIVFFRIILSAILHRLARSAPYEAHHTTANRAFGVLPGLITGGVYAAIVAALLLSLPVTNVITKEARESEMANRLGIQVAWLDEQFSPIFGAAAKETLNRTMVKPESDETVSLHYTVTEVRARSGLEADMLVLVNKERVKRGIPPVKPDPELSMVARAHSTDMFARGYFSHYTPERKDPFDRMKLAGVKFHTAGENLALGRTLKICHEGLMNSPGHKANILNPAFGRLGIGIIDGGIYGLMISQEFRN